MKGARLATGSLLALALWVQTSSPLAASPAKPGGARDLASGAVGNQIAGEHLYSQKCGICHASGRLYPGYVQLAARGVRPAALQERTNLNKAYIVVIVRHGLGSMPMFTPGQVTDAQLDAIASWLAGAK